MLVRIHGAFTYYTARQPTYPVATADLWDSPFFLVAFHGNFTSGTAQSGSLTDVDGEQPRSQQPRMSTM